MDSFEFNKIAGAVLSAALFIFGTKALVEMVSASHAPQIAGYELPAPKGGSGPGKAEVEAFNFAKVAELMPKANAEAGKDIFKACTQCHTPEKSGPNKQGPNLYGVVGRDVAKHAGFTNYSPALVEKGGKWTWDLLATYLNDPRGTIPRNSMSFVGVKDPNDLADLLVYLRTLADSPAALPK